MSSEEKLLADTQPELGPIQLNERIVVLDILRGFALLGILLVNMSFFSYPMMYSELTGIDLWSGFGNGLVMGFINIFVEGKFYTMFSFLFGLGFLIFMERAEKRRKYPRLLFIRRLLILLCIGLIHAFFIWSGDILVFYAVLGFLLLLFYHRKPKTLLIWAVIFIMTAILPTVLSVISVGLAGDEFGAYMQDFMLTKQQMLENSLYAYSEGSYSELMAQRTYDVLLTYQYAIFALPLIFPMFLLGAYVGKRRIFQIIPENLPFIKRVWKWSLVIGLTMSIVKFTSGLMVDPALPSIYDVISMIGRVVGDPILSFFYMTSIILLTQSSLWANRLRPFANVGRMALSNYLFQSIVCTTIFYSYGLGLYGKADPAVGLLMTLVIFLVQIPISRLWLQKYRYGPIEWVWRALTYGKL